MKKKTIKGYKGFNPDMTCLGFQYEIGKEYETEKAKACEQGFLVTKYGSLTILRKRSMSKFST